MPPRAVRTASTSASASAKRRQHTPTNAPASLPTSPRTPPLRIHRPPLPTPDVMEERASPSKYPTPLPDEGPPTPEEEELDDTAVRTGVEMGLGLGLEIEMEEEEEEQEEQEQEQEEPAYEPEPPAAALTKRGEAVFGRARKEPTQCEQPAPAPERRPPQKAQAQSHLRAPEVPRPPAPPLALSALSHTLRALAASTQHVIASGTTAAARRASMSAGFSGDYGLGNGTGNGLGKKAVDLDDGEEEDTILGARWDEVEVEVEGDANPRPHPRPATRTRTLRLLTLTYARGVQVWDASALGGVCELVNLAVPVAPLSLSATIRETVHGNGNGNGNAHIGGGGEKGDGGLEKDDEMRGPIVQAGVLPAGPGRGLELGVLTPHALYVYDLRAGRVVSVWDVASTCGTPCGFDAAARVVVVRTHSPPALIVLSRATLRVQHTFPASALGVATPVPHPPTNSNNSNNSTSTSYSSTSPASYSSYISSAPSPGTPAPPAPVCALHGRLLAFLAPAPAAQPAIAAPPGGSATGSASPPTGDASWLQGLEGRLGRFFSRSAPAASAALTALAPALGTPAPGSWVRVVDLGVGMDAPPEVHVFQAARGAVSALAFARDGTRLFVVRRDGLGVGVWGLRPASASASSRAEPAQLYDLRRGRTGAVVEALAGARDGRFVALATRRRTVHVFAVNPYGGRADAHSHLGARVRDGETAAGVGAEGDRTTEVHPLVRLRLPGLPAGREERDSPPPAPLAIAFVAPDTRALLAPGAPASPAARSAGVQDVLVFDPADGVLALRRVTVALEAAHHVSGLPVSVSLPAGRRAAGMGTSMSVSPPGPATSYVRGGGVGAVEAPMELGAREAVVATWSLRRRRGWAEIRRAEVGETAGVDGRPGKEDWLAQAELSTFSRAPRVLPRPIYLSHQFSFHTLGEDYHALIRRFQFDIGGAKLEVRKEVEVSAYAAGVGGGESFVEGFASSPRAIRRRSRASSSFDEPLASALAGAHYALPPPVLPMLPNGSPASFRSSIPIRTMAGLGDGVAEGLGRLRREMRHQRQKQLVRSPPARRVAEDMGSVEASVPLAFDEEDEDFVVPPSGDDVYLRVHADREDDDALSATTSRNGEDSAASISTPATSSHPLEDDDRLDVGVGMEGEWHGWAAEDTQAVEEAERFDDISVVGFLDEEQAAMQAEAERRKAVAARGARGKKRRN